MSRLFWASSRGVWYLSVAVSLSIGCNSFPEIDSLAGGEMGTNSEGSGASSSGAGKGSNIDLGLGGARGSGAAASSGQGATVSCSESDEEATLVPANLLFVVDKSGSMNCNAFDSECKLPEKIDSTELSKWEITQDALTGGNGALQTLAGQVGVSAGLIAFPTDAHCGVPAQGDVTVSLDSLTVDQLASLGEGLSLAAAGETPLAGAAIRGLEVLRRGIHSGELEGDNYLVLMTDGVETCQTDAIENLKDFVTEAEKFYGIRTYAIGAPGSEGSRALLSEIAVLGGTRKSTDCKEDAADASEACHIDLTTSTEFAKDLGAEFRGITEETANTCEYDVPANALVDPKLVNVEYTPSGGKKSFIAQDAVQAGEGQCENAEGWQFSPDGKQIVICGTVCDDILSDAGADVRVIFGCQETVTVVR